ncbi:MAG: PilZ domain-containing protein [Lachnospiraceae bacterium]|nr:PilZ domain-containing protein [Lachnospiraceae bacterium]
MENGIDIGVKLDIERMDDRLSQREGEKQIYVSQVLDETENGNLLVAMPIKEGKVIPFSVGQQLVATFYTKSGLLQGHVIVAGRFKKGELFLMEISLNTQFKRVQRREFFRYDCRMPLEYRLVGEEEQRLLTEYADYDVSKLNPEWRNAAMIDLSGGGMHFVSTSREANGSLIQVRFEIKIAEEVQIVCVFATVLRCSQNENQSRLYNTHIKFQGIDKKLQEQIVRFIFEEQIRQRSKQSGKK